jgi:hypothetical protein
MHQIPGAVTVNYFVHVGSCQKVSKAMSQKYWLAKPENRNHWRGAEQVARVRAWRKENLQYRLNIEIHFER